MFCQFQAVIAFPGGKNKLIKTRENFNAVNDDNVVRMIRME